MKVLPEKLFRHKISEEAIILAWDRLRRFYSGMGLVPEKLFRHEISEGEIILACN